MRTNTRHPLELRRLYCIYNWNNLGEEEFSLGSIKFENVKWQITVATILTNFPLPRKGQWNSKVTEQTCLVWGGLRDCPQHMSHSYNYPSVGKLVRIAACNQFLDPSRSVSSALTFHCCRWIFLSPTWSYCQELNQAPSAGNARTVLLSNNVSFRWQHMLKEKLETYKQFLGLSLGKPSYSVSCAGQPCAAKSVFRSSVKFLQHFDQSAADYFVHLIPTWISFLLLTRELVFLTSFAKRSTWQVRHGLASQLLLQCIQLAMLAN